MKPSAPYFFAVAMCLASRLRRRVRPHVGPVCCACAEMEVRRLFVMLAEDVSSDEG
jgi:hypothetical protein